MKRLVLVFCLLSGLQVKAQQTALDSTFGVNGSVIPPQFLDYNIYCTQQADGKLITAATFQYPLPTPTQDIVNGVRIQRWQTNGQPDSTFNTTGIIEYETGTGSCVMGIRALADGKIIVVAGPLINYDEPIISLRLLGNGIADSSYSSSGVAWHSLPSHFLSLEDAVILQDGGVAFTGYKGVTSGYDLAVYRLDSTGAYLTGFGTAGKATYNFGAPFECFGVRIAEAASGKLLVSVQKNMPGLGTDSIGVIRILSDGSLDPSFGIGGVVFKYIPHGWIRVEDVVEGQNGAVTFAALTRASADTLYHRTILQLTANGSMDPAFGNAGMRALTSIPLQRSSGSSDFFMFCGRTTLNLQSDGKVVVGLTSTYSSQNYSDACIVRLLQDGSDDPTFGTNSWASSHTGFYALNNDVLLQSDGKIVQASNLFWILGLIRYKPIPVLAIESLPTSTISVRIYPNPATGTDVRIDGAPNDATIYLTDATGRAIRVSYQSGLLDVSRLTPGLYFLRIESSEGAATFRLVKSEQ